MITYGGFKGKWKKSLRGIKKGGRPSAQQKLPNEVIFPLAC
jgi:hypothetical protein